MAEIIRYPSWGVNFSARRSGANHKTHKNTMKRYIKSIHGLLCGAFLLMNSDLLAQDRWPSTADGFYRAGSIEVQVINGLPRSSQIIDNTLQLIRTAFSENGIDGSISSSESGDTTTFLVKYGFEGVSVELRVEITRSSSVNGDSATVVNTYRVSSTVDGEDYSDEFTVSESLLRNPTDNTISYSGDPEYPEVTLSGSLILKRITLGMGTENDPFIPPNANWTRIVVVFIPIYVERPVNTDPPMARGFDYAIQQGRQERFSVIKAPKGFGKKLKVYASAKKSGPMKLVGTVASGKSINIAKVKGFAKGAARVRVEGLEPRADLSKRAPYPVGLGFKNLKEAMAAVKIKSIR